MDYGISEYQRSIGKCRMYLHNSETNPWIIPNGYEIYLPPPRLSLSLSLSSLDPLSTFAQFPQPQRVTGDASRSTRPCIRGQHSYLLTPEAIVRIDQEGGGREYSQLPPLPSSLSLPLSSEISTPSSSLSLLSISFSKRSTPLRRKDGREMREIPRNGITRYWTNVSA